MYKRQEINGEIKNTSGAVTVNLNFNGMYKTACDRCLEAVAIPLNATISTIITGKESKDDSVSIIDGKIDLQKTAYDALCLEIPIQVLCKDDCKGLCFECGQNLNVKQCECDK